MVFFQVALVRRWRMVGLGTSQSCRVQSQAQSLLLGVGLYPEVANFAAEACQWLIGLHFVAPRIPRSTITRRAWKYVKRNCLSKYSRRSTKGTLGYIKWYSDYQNHIMPTLKKEFCWVGLLELFVIYPLRQMIYFIFPIFVLSHFCGNVCHGHVWCLGLLVGRWSSADNASCVPPVALRRPPSDPERQTIFWVFLLPQPT